MILPDGLDSIIETYGNPFTMAGSPAEWEKRYIQLSSVPPGLFTWLGRRLGAMRVNGRVSGTFRGAFVEAARAQLQGIAFERAYEWKVVDNELSIHTWGIALKAAHPDAEKDALFAEIMAGAGFVRFGDRYQLATGYEVE